MIVNLRLDLNFGGNLGGNLGVSQLSKKGSETDEFLLLVLKLRKPKWTKHESIKKHDLVTRDNSLKAPNSILVRFDLFLLFCFLFQRFHISFL